MMDSDNFDDRYSGPAPADALRELRERGVDRANDVLAESTPEIVLEACRQFDAHRAAGKRIGPGLLVQWIREGAAPEAPAPKRSKGEAMRALFSQYAELYPEGAVTESHRAMIARRWPAELADACAGRMVVQAAIFPTLDVECDRCRFAASYPARQLNVLGPPLRAAPEPPPADIPF